ncbi:MAG TPA: signal recognition particle protein, partial [Sphingomicrobium sp.]|nr:signal recognition particle protein [Sphingomicrobium sp.]
KIAAKMAKGKFDLDYLWAQLRQMQRMGGIGALAGMMPGLKGMKGAMDKAQDSKALVHMEAMLSSMTAKEREKPELINAKRKIRVAKGSGTTVQEINKLLKMHQEMATAMKRLKKMGGFSKLAAMFGGGGGPLGGLGGPGGAGGLPGLGGAGALPGLGGAAPFNLPQGFDKFSKK